MRWIYLICFTLTSTGLLALFGVKPRDFTDAIFNFRRKVPTLTDELNVLTGKPARVLVVLALISSLSHTNAWKDAFTGSLI